MASTTRVSTLNSHQILLSNFTRQQGELTTLQRQISSGRKAQIFAQLEGKVERVTGLENKVKTLDQYIENNTVAITRLQTMGEATKSLQALTDEVISDIILARSATKAQYPILANGLVNKLEQVAGLLNSNIAGRYVFAGSKTDQPPVASPIPTSLTLGLADAGYYRGDDVIQQVRAMDNLLLNYGINADNQAFQDLIAAANIAIDNLNSGSTSLLDDALTMANNAADGINGVNSQINGNIVALNDTIDLHKATSTYIKGAYGEEISTDVVAASTDVATNEAVLQAAFQAFSRTSELRLSSFLR